MENDIYAILASLPDEHQAQQLSHEGLIKVYCAHYRFSCQLAQTNVGMRAQLNSLQKNGGATAGREQGLMACIKRQP